MPSCPEAWLALRLQTTQGSFNAHPHIAYAVRCPSAELCRKTPTSLSKAYPQTCCGAGTRCCWLERSSLHKHLGQEHGLAKTQRCTQPRHHHQAAAAAAAAPQLGHPSHAGALMAVVTVGAACSSLTPAWCLKACLNEGDWAAGACQEAHCGDRRVCQGWHPSCGHHRAQHGRQDGHPQGRVSVVAVLGMLQLLLHAPSPERAPGLAAAARGHARVAPDAQQDGCACTHAALCMCMLGWEPRAGCRVCAESH